ncbi:YIP1 family protein [Celeribacter sp.]|uniref:YIP1 family protein n=1 Tax=Celeribacter sp. TaxID=1890673 RepID=UPI003A90770E
MGVVSDILRSYRQPRAVVRHRVGKTQDEARALITLVLACGLIFVAQWPRLSRIAFETGQEVQMLIGGALLGWMFIAPLAFYVLAALVALVLRVASREVTGYAVRVATFWALLAAAPLWLLAGLAGGLVGPSAATSLTGAIALIAFVVIWGAGLTEVAFAKDTETDV